MQEHHDKCYLFLKVRKKLIVHAPDIMGNLYFEHFATFVPQKAQKVQNPYSEERRNDNDIKAVSLRYAFKVKMVAYDFLLESNRHSFIGKIYMSDMLRFHRNNYRTIKDCDKN